MGASHEGSVQDLHTNQHEQAEGGKANSTSCSGLCAIRCRRRCTQPWQDQPEHVVGDQQCQSQVCGETQVTDRRPIDQAGLDHVPAQNPLQATENEGNAGAQRVSAAQGAAHHEHQPRQGEQHAEQSTHQPVQVLPEEDALEVWQLHPMVDRTVLGAVLVEIELLVPGLLAQGWQSAHQRLPVHHRQARTGKAHRAAHHHHCGNGQVDDAQPDQDGT